MASRSGILSLYKKLLRTIELIDEPVRKEQAFQQARHGFRANRGLQDPSQITKLVNQVESKLAFLEMSVPRRGKLLSRPGRIIQKDGKFYEQTEDSEEAGSSAFKDNRITDEQMERHHRLLR